jgi:hypothetical protein
LFAPFFSGAAGAGMSWHWESYVDRNNLWYHYGRFNEAVKGLNPLSEKFVPSKSETGEFRIYILNGQNTLLAWVREKNSNWMSELEEGRSPVTIRGIKINIRDLGISGTAGRISVYNPWSDEWHSVIPEGTSLSLPDFKRSLILRIEKAI